MIEILKHTPPWVFILFFALVRMGYTQSKDRSVNPGKVAVLPFAMVGLSFYGVLSAFGIGYTASWIYWLIGISVASLISLKFPTPVGVSYSTKERTYLVPGSWFPLSLMMILFFLKYAVGVLLARQLPILEDRWFIASVCVLYGLISGIFLFRAFVIWHSKKQHLVQPAFD